MMIYGPEPLPPDVASEPRYVAVGRLQLRRGRGAATPGASLTASPRDVTTLIVAAPQISSNNPGGRVHVVAGGGGRCQPVEGGAPVRRKRRVSLTATCLWGDSECWSSWSPTPAMTAAKSGLSLGAKCRPDQSERVEVETGTNPFSHRGVDQIDASLMMLFDGDELLWCRDKIHRQGGRSLTHVKRRS